jgi:hypothetical protein
MNAIEYVKISDVVFYISLPFVLLLCDYWYANNIHFAENCIYHDGRKGNMEIFAACYLKGILVFSYTDSTVSRFTGRQCHEGDKSLI